MKKRTLCLSILTLLGAASCKKDDKKDNSNSSNSWKVGSKSYNSANVTLELANYSSMTADKNAYIIFRFKSLPKADGIYTVKEGPASKDNEVFVTVSESYGGRLHMGDAISGDVTVLVDGNKTIIKCSDIKAPVYDVDGNTIVDSVVSANLTYIGY